MSIEEQNQEPSTSTEQPQQPEGGIDNPNDTPTDHAQPPAGGKTLTIPTSAMAKIKSDAQEKGRKEAEAVYLPRLEKLSKFLGFTSLEEMEAADPEDWRKRQSQSRTADGSRSEQQKTPATKPATEEPVSTNQKDDQNDHPRYTKKLEADRQKLLDKTRLLNRRAAQEERRRRQVERELEATKAETALRVAAAKAGVHDVDYALHLLKQDMRGKPAEELASFNEDEYFSKTLRQKHPHLYGTETRPATSGVDGSETGKGGAPPPANGSAGGSNGGGENPKSLDAKKLSREEYQELLKKRGLTDPSVGMPS